MTKTTAQVVAERPLWLRRRLADHLKCYRTQVLLALCGSRPGGMAMNQADLLVTLAEEALASAVHRDEVAAPPNFSLRAVRRRMGKED